jgi:hypothetical protein
MFKDSCSLWRLNEIHLSVFKGMVSIYLMSYFICSHFVLVFSQAHFLVNYCIDLCNHGPLANMINEFYHAFMQMFY